MSSVTAPEASTSGAAATTSIQQQDLLPQSARHQQQQQPQQQQLRKGTKQESFESRGKKGTSGSNALSRALTYNVPLPLYLPHVDSNLSLLFSLSWTLSLSYQIILSQFKNKRHSRNKIPREAYLDEKIVGFWDARTKSVWVLPTRRTQQHKMTPQQQSRRRKSKRRNETASTDGSNDEAGSSTGSSATEEGIESQEDDENTETHEITPWMDLLWKRGFFGKGSLSRSEHTWWQREKNRVTGEHVPTAEDITSARRADRVIVKKQKAQERAEEKEKQALALAEQRKRKEIGQEEREEQEGGEGAVIAPQVETSSDRSSHVATPSVDTAASLIRGSATDAATEDATVDPATAQVGGAPVAQPNRNEIVREVTEASAQQTQSEAQSINKARGMPAKTRLPNVSQATIKQEAKMKQMSLEIPNLEYTQLQREEAFFIALSTGSIDIFERVPRHQSSSKPQHPSTSSRDAEDVEGSEALQLFELWKLFTRASLDLSTFMTELEFKSALNHIRPDNPFIISYVVYHHYRSLGWVVRNGVKFCVDWVLYKGADGVEIPRGGAGPVGGHAEFAVAIIPTYQDPSDAPSSVHLKHRRDWRWLNTVNRVCSGVKKTVILTYVTIPRMRDFKTDSETGALLDWTNPGCLQYYNIKEVSIKRFIPTRMRD